MLYVIILKSCYIYWAEDTDCKYGGENASTYSEVSIFLFARWVESPAKHLRISISQVYKHNVL